MVKKTLSIITLSLVFSNLCFAGEGNVTGLSVHQQASIVSFKLGGSKATDGCSDGYYFPVGGDAATIELGKASFAILLSGYTKEVPVKVVPVSISQSSCETKSGLVVKKVKSVSF